MLWTIALLVATAALVKSDCVGQNGDTYPENTGPYPAGDGCNTCQCTNGAMECTQNSCGCRSFMSEDWVTEGSTTITNQGCTRCTCTNGEMDCTHLKCGCSTGNGNWVASGTRFQPDCNWCYCSNVHAACTLMGYRDCRSLISERSDMAMKMLWVTVCLMSVASLVRADCVDVGEYGDTYPDNTGPYPAGDGCNTCQCTNGAMVCTQNSCGCMYHAGGRMLFAEGSTIVGNDGCTRCTCSGGEMSCTHMNCSCRVDGETWVESGASHQRDCNTCTCSNNKLACTKMACWGCYTDTGYHEINTSWTANDGCNTCRCTMRPALRIHIHAVCTRNACTQTVN